MDQAAGQGSQHSRKSTTECLKRKRIKVLQWSTQHQDPNPTEVLCWDPQRAVHKQMPTKLNELKYRCKEERVKFSGGDVRDYSQRNHHCDLLLNPGDVLHTAAAFWFQFWEINNDVV